MTTGCLRNSVRSSLERTGLVAVVRAGDVEAAKEQTRHYLASALELIEVTFTVPEAPALVLELFRARGKSGPPWIGMGTVTDRNRAEQAVSVGAEFLVTPNVAPDVAALAKLHELFLIMGALTPTELVTAHQLGADVLKVYPLPPVGGPKYLATLRQPLGDLAPMLAAGGFEIEEIPAYRRAGALAFGLGAAQLLGKTPFETTQNVNRALELARAPLEVWSSA
jgi:2-dehydro-3-deoxyphosphogluconate aldolase/(4S)-4-hydroxy-2-oxoglutarate aldolase